MRHIKYMRRKKFINNWARQQLNNTNQIKLVKLLHNNPEYINIGQRGLNQQKGGYNET